MSPRIWLLERDAASVVRLRSFERFHGANLLDIGAHTQILSLLVESRCIPVQLAVRCNHLLVTRRPLSWATVNARGARSGFDLCVVFTPAVRVLDLIHEVDAVRFAKAAIVHHLRLFTPLRFIVAPKFILQRRFPSSFLRSSCIIRSNSESNCWSRTPSSRASIWPSDVMDGSDDNWCNRPQTQKPARDSQYLMC